MQAATRYATPAMLVHWFTAVLVLSALGLGYYLSGLSLSPTKLQLISYHKWLGVTVLLLFLPRLLLRLRKPAPEPVATMAPWQRTVAAATHRLLYALLLAVPLSGWLMSSAKGFPVVYLGLMPLPDLVGKDQSLGDFLKSVHEILTLGLLTLVGLHIAAALKHHFIDRDETLVRMAPVFKRSN